MSDHSHFEELAALQGGGFLSQDEQMELQEHLLGCSECNRAQQEFNNLVCAGLPLTIGRVREFSDKMKTRPDHNIRSRFLHRAKAEGIVFSSAAQESIRQGGRRAGFFLATATALAAAVIMLFFYGPYRHLVLPEQAQSRMQADQTTLSQENIDLTASIARLNQSLASKQHEIENLQAQLEKDRKSQFARGKSEPSSAQAVQLLDELRNQDRLLAETRDETARINQLRVTDQASLAEQQARVTDLSYRLRIASATLDEERQLAAAGKDVRELMLSRQLHVIDVHDSDTNGNPSKAFGRVFLTEGKSLTFYAFDLNEESAVDSKHRFQVWAVPENKKNPARNLGLLHVDAAAQGRWVLKVENPEFVKEINSVFVTVEPGDGGKQPNGPKRLYAYVGQANHP